jgi:hypothetical protein
MKGADRRRRRRPGAGVLILVFVTAAVALALYYRLGVPAVVGVVVTVVLGLPSLYQGWVPLRQAWRPPDRSLTQVPPKRVIKEGQGWGNA